MSTPPTTPLLTQTTPLSSTSLYYAQVSIGGERDYRYTVRGNADVPGCVDLLAEIWEEKTQSWCAQMVMECIPADTLTWLAKMAHMVVSIETTGDETKVVGTAQVTP